MDFDIDKAYIMGYEFDDNGKYVGWSDLFDYSSIDTLKASEFLPTPNKVAYYKGQLGLDVTSYITKILQSPDRASKIMAYAELLNKLGDELPEVDSLENKKLAIIWDSSIDENIANNIVARLNKHEFTKLSPLMIEAAYKNSVSSNILNIVQDLRNMDAAYSPIEMEGIRKASTRSPKGSLASNMTLMNPLTKYAMLVLNMVGKGVIGITAVGEKVFFNNSYYWNEGIRSQDSKWINNMKFSQTFDRIQGRGSGRIVPITKTTIANANFEGLEDVRLSFIDISAKDSELRQKYEITDLDIETKSDKWLTYHYELVQWTSNQLETNTSADLSISELLSAATDNAKELILAKINAGTNLARMYLHLIIMGFSINDIVLFMISPTVSLINDLSEANMFDEYVYQMRVLDAAKILEGNLNPNLFFSGETRNEEGDTTSNSKIAFNILKVALNGKLEMEEGKNGEMVPKKYKKFQDLVRDFMMSRIYGNNIGTLMDNITRRLSPDMLSNMEALSDYVESIIEKIQAGINSIEIEPSPEDTGETLYLKKLSEFYADLTEFNKVWDLATETSTLGSGFYGLNQGLPTSKADLMGKLRTLENAVSSRETAFGIELSNLIPLPSDTNSKKEEKEENLANLLSSLKSNNPLLDSDHIALVFATSIDAGLVNNFNIETWLMDDYVSLSNGEIVRYRDLVSDYYNIIKGTWNIFDMIERIPHYNSIFKLLKTVYVSDSAVSRKSNIVNLILRKVIEESGFLDELGIKQLLRYVDELLITNWLKESDFKFPVLKGEEFFNRYVDRVTSPRNSFVDLATSEGRASFKLLMESTVIPNLKAGFYNDIERVIGEDGLEVINVVRKEIPSNAFIDGLMDNVDGGIPFKKLNIDMMNINSTPASSIKFLSYLDGLYKMKNLLLNGRPLSDWFMIYNFIVNQNRYGSDRLTTIFKPFIGLVRDESVIKKYFLNTGKLDYSSIKSYEDLESLGFNMRDAFIKMAPFVSKTAERLAKTRFIRQSDGLGGVIYKERQVNGSYKLVPILPKKTLSGDGNLLTRNQRLKDFQEYWTIQTPSYDAHMNIQTNAASQDIDELVQALMEYTSKGILKIYKENC